MGVDDGRDDRQAKTGPTSAAATTRRVRADEPIEEPALEVGRNSATVVDDRESSGAVSSLDGHLDRGPPRCMHECVRREVRQHLCDLMTICRHTHLICCLDRDLATRLHRLSVGNRVGGSLSGTKD